MLDIYPILVHNSCMNEMWNTFSDFELAELAGVYGLEDFLVFNDKLQLANRTQMETLITEAEYNLAFPVDFNSNVMYNSDIEIEETI